MSDGSGMPVEDDETGQMPALRPISYLVLGMIGLRGASTSYEIKRAADRTVHYFWGFSHSQLYGEPERLAKAGLLTKHQEETGRRRKTYALTARGRDALRQWLRQPPPGMFEYRDPAVLQLFFSDFMTDEELVALARHEVELCRERMQLYEEIQRRNAWRGAEGERRMAPLKYGFRLTETVMNIWQEVADDPPRGTLPAVEMAPDPAPDSGGKAGKAAVRGATEPGKRRGRS